jgi:hypothetical protein
MATLVIMTVTPVFVAMSIAIDSVAVLVSIGPRFVRPSIAGYIATREAHEGSDRTQYRQPIKRIHGIVPLQVFARWNSDHGTRLVLLLCAVAYGQRECR